MEALYDDVGTVAGSSTKAPILIYGETGAGKEMVAQRIHDASPRKSRPFIRVNCSEFTEALVASALFGHKRGAFTGAHAEKKGYFDAAHTGTLFLDEIAELPLETQATLLRVLDYGAVCPLGDTQSHIVDVRVVAETNKNLLDCVQRGKFRDDLYYRLKGFVFEVPPLRKRPKDIVPLAARFLADTSRRDNQPHVLRLSETAIARLRSYHFPGNVRELKNAVEVAAVHCRGTVILPEHFPAEISRVSAAPPEPKSTPNAVTPPNDERAILMQALVANGFNQKQTAMALGISNRTLVNRLNRHPDIPRPKKKHEDRPPVVDLPPATPISLHGGQSYDGWPNGEF
jgi:transcriptional regulator with PAS, ATPase and Fis domain